MYKIDGEEPTSSNRFWELFIKTIYISKTKLEIEKFYLIFLSYIIIRSLKKSDLRFLKISKIRFWPINLNKKKKYCMGAAAIHKNP